jgi:hypothetical protein
MVQVQAPLEIYRWCHCNVNSGKDVTIGVIDTGGKFAASVNNIGGQFGQVCTLKNSSINTVVKAAAEISISKQILLNLC